MADLHSKLARLGELGRRVNAAFTPREPGELAAPDDRLPGHLHHTEHGPVHVIGVDHPLAYCHGSVALGPCQNVTAHQIATLSLDGALNAVDVSRLLFIDTETTGLAGGAGTVPFLVGIGWFENARWRMQQLLLRRPGEEGPMLQWLAERLAWASGLVSYNGKSFDWPLLKTRFILNRILMPPPLPHLDLLHCVRRVYRRRQTSMRLVSIERDMLGFQRVDDIDGSAIPALYFAFLRGAPAASLTPIITHNAYDLMALAAILGSLAEVVAVSQASTLKETERLSVAELTLRAGAPETASQFAQAAADGMDKTISVDALLLLARLSRRKKDFAAVGHFLNTALVMSDIAAERRSAIHLALAKYYEHQRYDVPRALEHALHTAAAEGEMLCAHRLKRLRRKLT